MYKRRKILAIIPARGGSKGLPHKNIRAFLEKPLIGWTIEQAKKSRYIDEVVVSTEDSRIAALAKKFGARVPFMRPARLAADKTAVSEVILHAIDFFEKKGELYDILVLLECTSPMRYPSDIDNIIKKLVHEKCCLCVVGVAEATNDHPLWTFRLSKGYLTKFIPQTGRRKNPNRQSLVKAFLPYSIYAIWWKEFKRCKTFFPPRTLPYVLRREQKVDIDDKVDFYLGECSAKKYLIPKRGTGKCFILR